MLLRIRLSCRNARTGTAPIGGLNAGRAAYFTAAEARHGTLSAVQSIS